MNTVLYGDVIEVLKTLPDESVQCCVTSPPYWGLRVYKVDGQIGLEKTPAEYLEKMTVVFREVRRVLRRDGTAWVNMGDGYAGSGKGAWNTDVVQKEVYVPGVTGKKIITSTPGLKPKDLVGMPWRLAFALQADGWYLRQDIIWSKPNPMPESVTDRCTKSHEYIFLLSKSARYFYDADAIREEGGEWTGESFIPKSTKDSADTTLLCAATGASRNGRTDEIRTGRNKRSVWTMSTQPYSGAHFATFPEELPRTCILAGTSPKACPHCGAPWKRDVKAEGGTIGQSWHDHDGINADGTQRMKPEQMAAAKDGTYRRIDRGFIPGCACDGNDGTGRCVVLDPFLGSGTTAMVAVGLGRDYIGIELNRDYAPLIRQRLALFYHEREVQNAAI